MPPEYHKHESLDALLDRTLGTAELSARQRERHLQRIGEATASRRWLGRRSGLAELLAVATIGLLALASVVAWQVLEGDQSAVVRGDERLYALLDGRIVEIDVQTGAVKRVVEETSGATNCSLLIASPDGDLLARVNFISVGTDHVFGISIYRVEDGRHLQDIAIPHLLQPLGRCHSVAFSADGSRLYAFQYEVPPGGTGDDARYWLGTFDLIAREWLPEIEIPGCRGGLIRATAVDRLLILCGPIYEIDPRDGEVLRTFGADIQDAVFRVQDDTLYVAAVNQTVLIQNLDATSDERRLLRGTQLEFSEQEVAGLPIGLDSTGRYLYVPVQQSEDHYVPVSSITVIDLARDEVARIITPRRPFHDIAYAADGRTAYIATSQEDGSWDGLSRIDLKTGEEQELLTGQIGNLVLISGSSN